jgi:hypothetical protein
VFTILSFAAFETVALWIAGRRGVSDSRRALAVALVAVLPGLGLVLAVLVRRLQGGGGGEQPPVTEAPPRELTREEVLLLADQPCALDRLMSLRPEERLNALVCLACANDANAITLLRWTVQHGPREAMLEAALTLEELDLQRARLLDEASRAFDERPCYATAVAAGEAALAGILNGLADSATVPTLAARARAWLRYAQSVDPARGFDLDQRLALLERDGRYTSNP